MCRNNSISYVFLQPKKLVHVPSKISDSAIISVFVQKVIKNPVIDHLPVGCTKIGTSFHADITDPRDLVPENEPVVFVVGALAHGSVST